MRLFTIILIILLTNILLTTPVKAQTNRVIPVRAIDTMKISRDISREKIHDPVFDLTIADHMEKIAAMGVTHVAIDTPYDDEFLPIMRRWVAAARKENLKIWYRGNFSGWEKWFNYPELSREEHSTKLKRFLENNPDLFKDGDIFTACHECEIGDPESRQLGDPKNSEALTKFRKFMLDEYKAMNMIFEKQNIDVKINYNSFNIDLALRFFDKDTTKAFGGIVGIDHYVATPEKLAEDIRILAKSSGGKIAIGEIGVPIPQIHGANMSVEDQVTWMSDAFMKLQAIPEVIAVNYWTSWGGSTALWSNNGIPSDVAKVVKNFYTGKKKSIVLTDESGNHLQSARMATLKNIAITKNTKGTYEIPYLYHGQKVTIEANGYNSEEIELHDNEDTISVQVASDEQPNNEISWWQRFINWLKSLFGIR